MPASIICMTVRSTACPQECVHERFVCFVSPCRTATYLRYGRPVSLPQQGGISRCSRQKAARCANTSGTQDRASGILGVTAPARRVLVVRREGRAMRYCVVCTLLIPSHCVYRRLFGGEYSGEAYCLGQLRPHA